SGSAASEQLREAMQALERANEELRGQREERQKADRARNEFLTVLSHELRNPVHAISNNAWLIRSRAGIDAELRRPAGAIERQVAKLSKLLEDLLDAIRIGRAAQLALETVQVQQIVGAAIEKVQASSDMHRRELAVEMPREPLYVRA